jgi:hypothetical protein
MSFGGHAGSTYEGRKAVRRADAQQGKELKRIPDL